MTVVGFPVFTSRHHSLSNGRGKSYQNGRELCMLVAKYCPRLNLIFNHYQLLHSSSTQGS